MSLPFPIGGQQPSRLRGHRRRQSTSPSLFPLRDDLSRSIDESTDQKLSIRVEFIRSFSFTIGMKITRIFFVASFLRFFFFSVFFSVSLRPRRRRRCCLPLDGESRVLVGETASNNFPLIIIVREGGANLCASTRTGCVQVENQPATTITRVI